METHHSTSFHIYTGGILHVHLTNNLIPSLVPMQGRGKWYEASSGFPLRHKLDRVSLRVHTAHPSSGCTCPRGGWGPVETASRPSEVSHSVVTSQHSQPTQNPHSKIPQCRCGTMYLHGPAGKGRMLIWGRLYWAALSLQVWMWPCSLRGSRWIIA